jgi:hypothetical protein
MCNTCGGVGKVLNDGVWVNADCFWYFIEIAG